MRVTVNVLVLAEVPINQQAEGKLLEDNVKPEGTIPPSDLKLDPSIPREGNHCRDVSKHVGILIHLRITMK